MSLTAFKPVIRRWGWAVLLCAVILLAPLPRSTGEPTRHTFHLEASSFAYEPAKLRVNPGDEVTIELAATDVAHGIFIDGYNLDLRAEPGQSARLTFTADQAGSFRFRCSVTCGAMHPFMIGKLHVGPNLLLWRALAAAGVIALAVLGRGLRGW